jgi:hypothetical protein
MPSTIEIRLNKDGRMAGQIGTPHKLCLVYEFYSKDACDFFSSNLLRFPVSAAS